METAKAKVALALVLALGFEVSDGSQRQTPAADPKLEEVLQKWARASDAVRHLRYTFRQTNLDKAFQVKEVLEGRSLVRKPDLLRVDFQSRGNVLEILVIADRT